MGAQKKMSVVRHVFLFKHSHPFLYELLPSTHFQAFFEPAGKSIQATFCADMKQTDLPAPFSPHCLPQFTSLTRHFKKN